MKFQKPQNKKAKQTIPKLSDPPSGVGPGLRGENNFKSHKILTSTPMKKQARNDIALYVRNAKSDRNPEPKIMAFSWWGEIPSPEFYVEEDAILNLTGFERKRLYLYLFRNKDIPKSEFDGKKLVDIASMLEYLGNTIRTLETRKKNK